jgi:hypothetical protein
MKNTTLPILAVLMLLSGCDLLEEKLTTDIDTELYQTFEVNITDEGTNITYSETEIIAAGDDPDLDEYIGNIKNYTVNNVLYSIKNYSGSQQITFTGSIQYSDQTISEGNLLSTFEEFLISSIADDGVKHELPYEDGSLSDAASILKDDNAIRVYLDGVFSEGPVSFELTVYYDVTVEASPLD